MNVKLPQEVEIWYLIPAIRREFARGLLKKGLRQREIARKLGITDAAISQYFSSKRGNEVDFSESIRKEISQSVDKIHEGANAMSELQRICRLCKQDRVCCFIHKHHGAPQDCKVCFPE